MTGWPTAPTSSMSSSSALTMLSSVTDDKVLVCRARTSWATAAVARCLGVEGGSVASTGEPGLAGGWPAAGGAAASGGGAAAGGEAATGGEAAAVAEAVAGDEAGTEGATSGVGSAGRAESALAMPSMTASTPSTSLSA
jgi:hypothetical protein